MTRKLASVVRIDAIRPIEGADAIEAAQVGGWEVVVRKGEFCPGDTAVYFEIDSFLPEGNEAWQFLVEKSSRQFDGRKGHVLRTIKLRGQVSQGLLLPVDALGDLARTALPDADLTDALGVLKYEPPVPAELAGVARSTFPSRIPKTEQARIQNLAAELERWQREGENWEVTEKLEGTSCTFAWLDDELHVCSRNLDLVESPENTLWNAARESHLAHRFAERFRGRNVALQGELVGWGIQGNLYGLRSQRFYLFDVYDADAGRYLPADAREALARELGLAHVPVIERAFRLGADTTMAALLAMADGASTLNSKRLREGLVFKHHSGKTSFKVVSNRYLLGQG
jgi:RNA ligase (TIGR02306 family)